MLASRGAIAVTVHRRSTMSGVLVWMDLEMTGLDHTSDVIVEIATIVTDDDLQIVEEGPDLVIHQPDEVLAAMDPFVVDMHTRSGLLDQIRASTVSLDEAGKATLEFIQRHVPEPMTVPLCGNSIGTDRAFLTKFMPRLDAHLHYRNVDVSSIKELAKRWFPRAYFNAPAKHGGHRALADILESILELRYYRRAVTLLDAEELASEARPALLDPEAGALEQRRQRRPREVRAVLVDHVPDPQVAQCPERIRDLEIDLRSRIARRGMADRLEKGSRLRDVLEHVAATDQIGREVTVILAVERPHDAKRSGAR